MSGLDGYLDLQAGMRTVRVQVRQQGARLHLTFPFNRHLLDEVKQMKGRRWHPEEKEWSIELCDRNLLQLRVLAGSPPAEYLRYLAEPPVTEPNRSCLKAHQRRGLNHAWHKRRFELAAWMGTGKTLVAFEVMEKVRELYPTCDVFYVSRSKVLASTQLEARKWKLRLTPTYISYDSLHSYLERWPKGRPAPRCVIFDECTALKRDTTKRYEAAQALVQAMREEHRDDFWVLNMSGTPAPQDPCDWWPQVELLYPGWLRESSVFLLRKRLAIIEERAGAHGSYPHLVGWREDERQLLAKRLAGLVLVINLDDTDLDLPDPEYVTINLPVAEETARAAWFAATTAPGGAQAMQALRQLSDGFQYTEEGETRLGTTPKDQALRDLLDQHEEGGRFITYAAYTASVDRCVGLAVAKGWEVLRCDGRGWAVVGSKRSQEQLLLALQDAGGEDDQVCYVGHPGAGGYGLNMQGVGAMCFYSNDFNAESRVQAEARPRRPGNKGLKIYDLCHLGTDALTLDRLRKKLDVQGVTLEEIRGCLQPV